MDKVMAWMTDSFAPKMNKLARNAWIAAIQEAILTAMPMIFIGSFVSLLTAFGGLVPGFRTSRRSTPSRWGCSRSTWPTWCPRSS